MELPNRKQKALYKTRGANIDVLAYFRNNQCADEFSDAINWIVEQWEAHNTPTKSK